MRHPLLPATFVLLLILAIPGVAQRTIDRIAARVENDIILESDVRELARYQQFLDGKSESNGQILDHLIDQWIVRNEAAISRLTQPSKDDLGRSIARLKRSFASPEEFDNRLKQSGMTNEDLRRITRSQLYQSNYLD